MRQLGNAVPSLLAETVARALLAQAFGREPEGAAPRLLPPVRRPVPPPEPVVPVPERHLRLIGRHAPHPGTGGGFRAARRVAPAPA